MGTPKDDKARNFPGSEDENAIENPPHSEMIDDGDDLDAVLAELGGDDDAIITVSKVNRQGKREVVERYHPGDFDLFSLRDQFGGGEYILMGRRGNRIAKGFPKRVTLAEAKTKPRQAEQGNDLAAVIRDGFAQQQQQLEQFLKFVLSQQQQPQNQVDPDAMRRAMINDMIQMKELIGGQNQNQALGPEKILDLLKTGMEMGKESAGGERSMLDVLTETVRQFGGPISDAIKQQQMMAARQQQTAQPVTAAPAGEAQPAGSPASDTEDQQVKMMKMYVAHLVNEAMNGGDPYLWADVIISKVPEADLKVILQQMDPVDYLGNIDNRVFTYREWFAELGADLKKQLGIPDVSGPGEQSQPAEPGDGEQAAIESHGAAVDDPAGESGGNSNA